MGAQIHHFDEMSEDNPVPKLFRKRVFGDRMLMAHVRLEKGCHVPVHQHENEQLSYVVSGRVLWTLGAEGTPERRQVEVQGGTFLVLPSQFPHGVDILEDTLIVDVLSPPGDMGVDRMARGE